jgi:uncharacterized protein YndB with AHSA1/START domain
MVFEARTGGAWRFAMNMGEQTLWVSGYVLELEPPHLLRFDFAWEGQEELPTPVTLRFVDLPDGGSRLELVHDQTAGGSACSEGWSWSLGCLRDYLEAELEPESPKHASNATQSDLSRDVG